MHLENPCLSDSAQQLLRRRFGGFQDVVNGEILDDIAECLVIEALKRDIHFMQERPGKFLVACDLHDRSSFLDDAMQDYPEESLQWSLCPAFSAGSKMNCHKN